MRESEGLLVSDACLFYETAYVNIARHLTLPTSPAPADPVDQAYSLTDMGPKPTNGKGKQRMTEEQQSQHQPDIFARSGHEAQTNQSRRVEQVRESVASPPSSRPLPPITRSSGKPLVSVKSNLKLDGKWSLQCYEYKYVTEHLQLHRFPIDHREHIREVDRIEPAATKQVNIVDGRIEAEPRGDSRPRAELQITPENISKAGGAKGQGHGEVPLLQTIRELGDEGSSEVASLTAQQEAQRVPNMKRSDAFEQTEPEQPDPAKVASARSVPNERNESEPEEETTDNTLPVNAKSRRLSRPDESLERPQSLTGSVSAIDGMPSEERRHSRMSIASVLNHAADSVSQGQSMS